MAPPVPSPQSLGLLPMGLLCSTCIRGLPCPLEYGWLSSGEPSRKLEGGGWDKTGIRGLTPWVLLPPSQKAVGPLSVAPSV